MSSSRLEVLLDRYFDGGLSDADRAELERVLLSSAQSRQIFWDFARMHIDASRWGQEEWGRRMATGQGADEVIEDRPWRTTARRPAVAISRRWVALLAAAACLAMLTVFLFKQAGTLPSTSPPTATTIPTATPMGIAVLASSIDAQWSGPPRSAGAVLEAGVLLSLTSGAAQIEFYSGARLIVEGPAEVELLSDMEAYCHHGRVVAQVPEPARGFKLASDRITVIDLGTEFGLHIPPAGDPEVHVFSGEVEVHPGRKVDSAATTNTKKAVTLRTGQAGRPVGGAINRVEVSPQAFLREAEYAQLSDGEARRRQIAWQTGVSSLSRDSAVQLHYTFPHDQYRSRTITNMARGAGAGGSSASIVGCSSADGRWPLSRAVEFRGPGDRMRLDVSGTFEAVTLLAWVRFDTLPNAYHALLAPDGQSNGILRWGVTGDGELRLGIARESGKSEPNWEVIMTGRVITPEQSGRWLFLASTFDGKSIRHYVDGRLVRQGDAYTPVPVSIGPAEVGNWRGPTPRFFRGRMDELAILSRALSSDELKALYDIGRPMESTIP